MIFRYNMEGYEQWNECKIDSDSSFHSADRIDDDDELVTVGYSSWDPTEVEEWRKKLTGGAAPKEENW